MKRADRIRSAIQRVYPTSGKEVIDLLVELDEQLVTPYLDRDWARATTIIEEWSRGAKAKVPAQAGLIEAEALSHLSQAHEALGRRGDAIRCISELLRLRTKSESRATLYERLVGLLIAEGRTAEARRYATHGYRYSRGRDSFCAERLRLWLEDLRE